MIDFSLEDMFFSMIIIVLDHHFLVVVPTPVLTSLHTGILSTSSSLSGDKVMPG